jgi:hypothetical protein
MIAEITGKALRVLDQYSKGFVLMAEERRFNSPLKNYEYGRSSRKRAPGRRDDRAYPEVDL